MALVLGLPHGRIPVDSTLASVPRFVDRVYFLSSCESASATPDGNGEVVPVRSGMLQLLPASPGASVAAACRLAVQEGHDVTVVLPADAELDEACLIQLTDPIVKGEADYTKGNRLSWSGSSAPGRQGTFSMVSNMVLSLLTKVASGYYQVVDVSDTCAAFSRRTIEWLDWTAVTRGRSYPMDLLVRLNYHSFRVLEIPRRVIDGSPTPASGVGFGLATALRLIRGLFWRMIFKYGFKSFHPLILFFALGSFLLPAGIGYGGFLVHEQSAGVGVTGPQAVLCALLVISGVQFLLFAMLFDMQETRH